MIIKNYGDIFQKKASDLWPMVGFNLGVLWVAESYLTSRCSTSRQRSAMSWKDLASSLRVCMICSDTGGRSMFVWPSWAGESTGEREGGQNTNHFTTCLLGFEMTCYFVVHHVVFTNLANASVGSIRRPRQDRLFLPLIKHRSPDDWICLQNDKKQTFRVESDLNSHLAQPHGLCLCHLHICRWLFSFGLHIHTNVCERTLNTFWGSRANLWKIWPSYIESYLSALILPTLQSFSYVSALQILKTLPLASLKSSLFQAKCPPFFNYSLNKWLE